jgi:hypothetical protein
MSNYLDECLTLIDDIDAYRKTSPTKAGAAYMVGFKISAAHHDITDLGEREFRKFLQDRGSAITRRTGDGHIIPFQDDIDFSAIDQVIDEVYNRLQHELVSGPPTLPT